MRPTEDLMAEHRAVKRMLEILEGMGSNLVNGLPVDPGDLQESIGFLRGFVDRCHHGKEEQWLFPALEAAGIPRQGGPIGVMLEEHEAGRARVRAMAEAAAHLASGDAAAGRAFAVEARAYAALLRGHIKKEDGILYPMADARLSAEQQAALLAGFERIETEVMGSDVHEAYHALLRRLEEAYLEVM